MKLNETASYRRKYKNIIIIISYKFEKIRYSRNLSYGVSMLLSRPLCPVPGVKAAFKRVKGREKWATVSWGRWYLKGPVRLVEEGKEE